LKQNITEAGKMLLSFLVGEGRTLSLKQNTTEMGKTLFSFFKLVKKGLNENMKTSLNQNITEAGKVLFLFPVGEERA
jgi:hypothetical protein